MPVDPFRTKMKERSDAMTEETINKLKQLEGHELKYKELIEYLGLPYVSGNSKLKQLSDLLLYCDYEILEKPTRYYIKEVYETIYNLTSNELQRIFDAILFQALLNNNGYPLYLSSMDILNIFKEINSNFAFTFSKNNLIKINEDYSYMNDMSEIVYSILLRWTNRRIESMAKRQFIRITEGYRLTKIIKNKDDFNIYIRYNVPLSTSEKISELDQLCNKIYQETYEAMFPQLSYKTLKQIRGAEEIKRKKFLSIENLQQFNTELNKQIAIATNNEYQRMKKVKVIFPPDNEWLKDKLTFLYSKAAPNFNLINEEACNKILSTIQLDKFTGLQRKEYIQFNIMPNPPFLFQNKLKELES